MNPRILIVLIFALFSALQVARSFAVGIAPLTAGAFLWPSHPRVQFERIRSEAALPVHGQAPLSGRVRRQIESLSAKAPLASEPYLIEAAEAKALGNGRRSLQLLLQARKRDPRSAAVRYSLAVQYLELGLIPEVLTELGVLARLLPSTSETFVATLGELARTPGRTMIVKDFLRHNPELEPAVLGRLASDARNAGLILSLWSRERGETEAPPEWSSRIIDALVADGQFERAKTVWAAVSGLDPLPSGIYNADFSDMPALAPFNWHFPNDGSVAEPLGDGRLQVIHYGRQTTVIAEQLLVLKEGSFEIAGKLLNASDSRRSIAWEVRCVPGGELLTRIPLDRQTSPSAFVARFTVSPACRAQRLQLVLTQTELGSAYSFTVSKLDLRRARR